MSKEQISSWFRWLTPILLGLVTASNARIWAKMDEILEKSVAYTDKQVTPLRGDIKSIERDMTDLKVKVAEIPRRQFGNGEGSFRVRER